MAQPVDLATFRGRVKARRLALEPVPSQEAMGIALGFSTNWGYGVESGRHTPDPDTMGRLAQYLKTDVQWLVFGDALGDSEFLASIRGYEPLLDARDKRLVLHLITGMVREHEEAAQLAADDAGRGLTAEQREIAERLNEETRPV